MRFVLCWLVVGCPTPPKDSAPDVVDSTSGMDSEGTESSPTDSEPRDTGTTSLDRDDDGDGYSERDGDCDDAHASVNPSMNEDCETWADDDCKGGNDGCRGVGFWEEYLVFHWHESDLQPVVLAGSRFVGSYGKFICDFGGSLVASPDPAPSCPDCLWVFRSEAVWEDPWEYGPCRDAIYFQDDRFEPRWWYESGWGFSYSNPVSGASSGIGWLLSNRTDLGNDEPWEIWVGPGYDEYMAYTFRMESKEDYIFASFLDYNFCYQYWRYGEPVRDYNP